MAFCDPADFFDAGGRLRPLSRIPRAARACIAGLEVARANFDPTDGVRSKEWLHKIKLTNKAQALELLARHFSLLNDHVKVDVGFDAELLARLDRGRARLAEARPVLALPPAPPTTTAAEASARLAAQKPTR